MHPSALKVHSEDSDIIQYRLEQKARQKLYYNRSAKDLPNLHPGDIVSVRDPIRNEWNNQGVVTNMVEPRSYNVQTESGALLRRNRTDIRTSPTVTSPTVSEQSSTQVHAPEETVVPRRSPRERCMPKRLIETM